MDPQAPQLAEETPAKYRHLLGSAALTLIAVVGPIVVGIFLVVLASTVYTSIDRGGSRVLALVPLWLALTLPAAQVFPDVVWGSSKLVHAITVLMAVLSWPWYFMLIFMVSWTHH